MNSIVIIIGATGFIGVYTAEHFKNLGYDVLATGSNPAAIAWLQKLGIKTESLLIQNAEDFDRLPTKGVEGVILLGGLLPANVSADSKTDEKAADYFAVNTVGCVNVLEYCRKNGIKKVIATTSYSDVIKSWKKDVPLTESEPRNFQFTGDHAAYVISKNAAVDIMEYYHQQHGLQTACFRLPPVYGVGPHGDIFVDGKLKKSGIQTFVENAQAGRPIEIWGDPQTSRDIIYVKDVAAAFELALGSDATGGLYNMTSGVAVSLEDQVRTVIGLFSPEDNRSEIVYSPEKKNNTPSYLFDMSKAERDFGFTPQYTSFCDMMSDYKAVMDSGKFDDFIESRRKN